MASISTSESRGARAPLGAKISLYYSIEGAQPVRMATDFGRDDPIEVPFPVFRTESLVLIDFPFAMFEPENLGPVEFPFVVFRSESLNRLSFLLLCSDLRTFPLLTSNLLYLQLTALTLLNSLCGVQT
ncbi:hypothetical protein CEXT_190381 [Caerostris extrusa]|uniref:Uncharacterized protein n=1 Tax=Caerostris extrusa TaxID=172846 RepID=A0AAV4M3S0_CAEEX|nr:hypothetical protein CEXT_190381 [Caerostris extrusa]